MVAHEPGPWWDESLVSLAAQTYGELTVLVVASPAERPTPGWGSPGGGGDLEPRLRRILPRAVLHRLDRNLGFGPACTEVLRAVQGAAFYLFLHDDVRLDPDAVAQLVDEAVRSNAGIVGPKVVEWDDPHRLRHVGMAVDKFGVAAPAVEPGELDQEQHDAVRDCFYVPGGATLVRADLFAGLGGFDPGIDLIGEDLDLCWRAHVAGARVLVAPRARVAHREALAERGLAASDQRRRARRHRLRTVLTCYSLVHRSRVVPQLLVMTLVEVLAALVVGRVEAARDAAGAWLWVLGQWRSVRRRRCDLKAVRVVADGEVRALQVRGSAGANRFVRGQLETGEDHATVAGALVQLGARARSRSDRPTLLTLGAVAVVALVGSRHLLLQPVPAIGQFVPFDRGPLDLLRTWASGYDPAGLGGAGPNPTGMGLLGVAGVALLGAMGQLRRLLILGLLPLGALGVWRLARPVGSVRARLVALIVYLALPLAANALAAGRWGALVVWGLTPWIIERLARASAQEPFAAPDRHPLPPARALVHHGLAVGLLTALAAAVEPFALVLTAMVAGAMALGAVLAGEPGAATRIARTGLTGAGLAFVLHVPWSLRLVTGGWTDTSGTGAAVVPPLGIGRILRFSTGPVADSPLVWAVLLAALLPLLFGRQWRLGWALPAWVLVLGGVSLTWLGGRGWLPGLLPAPETVLAPAAVGVALAAALGVAAVEIDLPHYDFGWHQLAAVAVGSVSVIGVLPIVAASSGGRWGMPRGDFRQVVASIESPSERFRTLWIGDAGVVPLRGWALDAPSLAEPEPGRQLVYATTTGRAPDVENLWPGSRGGATESLTGLISEAASGDLNRLGARLAPLGIDYVIVPRRPAPLPYVTTDASDPDALVDLLASQLDLRRIDVVAGVHVFENTAPGLPESTGESTQQVAAPPIERVLRLLQVGLWVAAVLVLWRTRARRRPSPRDPALDGLDDLDGPPAAVPVGAERGM